MNTAYRFKVGEQIASKYLVLEQFPKGAKAEGYRVRCDGQEFALKIPIWQNQDLLHEQEILSGLADVPGAIRVYEERCGYLEDGKFYLVTEYVDMAVYTSLRDLKTQPSTEATMLAYLRSALQFYAALHRKGIEYYDAKPEHFLRDHVKGSFYVIDYNLCVAHEPPNFENTERLRWVIADLRRLAKTLQYTILGKEALVDDLPGAAAPLAFPGEGAYAQFLPGRLEDSAGETYRGLEFLLHALHGGAYRNAEEALKALDGFGAREGASADDQKKIANLVQQWNQGKKTPAWDQVEQVWGRMGEPELALGDYRDETAAYVYLWALALAYLGASSKSQPAGQYLLDILQSRQPLELPLKTHQPLEAIQPALAWLEVLRPAEETLRERQWKQVQAALEPGYSVALEKVKEFQQAFPDDTRPGEYQDYIKDRRSALKLFANPKELTYSNLDTLLLRLQPDGDLPPRAEDIHLQALKERGGEHRRLRRALRIMAILGLDEAATELWSQVKELEEQIAVCIENLLSVKDLKTEGFKAARNDVDNQLEALRAHHQNLGEAIAGVSQNETYTSRKQALIKEDGLMKKALALGNGGDDIDRWMDISGNDILKPYDEIANAVHKAIGDLNSLTASIGNLEKEISRLKKLISDQKKKIEKLNTNLTNAKAENSRLNASLEENKKEIENLQNSKKLLEKTVRALQGTLTDTIKKAVVELVYLFSQWIQP